MVKCTYCGITSTAFASNETCDCCKRGILNAVSPKDFYQNSHKLSAEKKWYQLPNDAKQLVAAQASTESAEVML